MFWVLVVWFLSSRVFTVGSCAFSTAVLPVSHVALLPHTECACGLPVSCDSRKVAMKIQLLSTAACNVEP